MSMADERPGRAIYSTGRGGAGNLMKSPTRGQDLDAQPGVERGRELSPHPVGEKVTHSGRGGAGNIHRSASRSRTREQLNKEEKEAAEEALLQEKLVAERRGRQAVEGGFSTGRGGAGNIERSKSRSRSAIRNPLGGSVAGKDDQSSLAPTVSHTPTQQTHHTVGHTGRGGFGNIQEERGDSIDLEKEEARQKYEKEVIAKHQAGEANQPFTSGKGGAGNMHTHDSTHPDLANLSLEEREAHARVHAHDRDHYVNTGRGGAGNMIPPHHSKEHSPADGDRGRGRSSDGHKGGMFGNVLRSLSRATGREKSVDGRRND
ncbi:uncharacterized protein I303_102159 [Kwoniella dejecticola CBS 10117]|uniref:Uncharacterized protein n=1 Tax=Kwoniella dejecticola CBS 10117 TaxID=1296121 RepID=A0A1A6ABR4_9TREE|nr:uncharacterized protein I303_01701 [Kwoniella dejecticola CBS 10117]OBR87495.1 hypothetical protein I303_01701 [Kwoniella dejecticola CBS 10117]